MRTASALALCIAFAWWCAPSAALAQLYNGHGEKAASSGSVGAAAPLSASAWHSRESSSSGLGGGLIELLVTGSVPESSRLPERAPSAEGAASEAGYALPPFGTAPRRARALAYAPLAAETYAHPRPVLSEPEPEFRRQEVEYHGPEAPGTIVIDTPEKFLFLVEPGGHAIRYGIGVGRPGFEWAGLKTITRKAEWPGWTPPPEMLKRRPDLPTHMEGGIGNPLGARALYLGSSLYRIHGTNEPETIGKAVSSGCIRMLNEDVVDLYGRVRLGTRVLVI
ncbi:MAG: L,D-transpeptidase [Hyphomicrobiales bacterium]|nr:L,D-transpeptidase [Hyphomicrobiales bacterium]